jgi:1-deoxy-D-xylulose-5-phosphate synthase
VPLRDLGIPQGWHPHGTRNEILADLGLTAQDVARQVTEWVTRIEETAPLPVSAGTRTRATRR